MTETDQIPALIAAATLRGDVEALARLSMELYGMVKETEAMRAKEASRRSRDAARKRRVAEPPAQATPRISVEAQAEDPPVSRPGNVPSAPCESAELRGTPRISMDVRGNPSTPPLVSPPSLALSPSPLTPLPAAASPAHAREEAGDRSDRVRDTCTRLATTINRLATARWGELPRMVMAGARSTCELAEWIVDAGVPWDVVSASVDRQQTRLSAGPTAATYYRPGIEQDWALAAERDAVKAAGLPVVSTRPSPALARGSAASMFASLRQVPNA